MKCIFFNGLILALSWLIMTQTVFAQKNAGILAEVKSSALISKSIITLGDLFDNLDTGRDIWVMNAPAPGKNISISTRYLASLTRQHNVYWKNSRNIRQITVTRKGKSIKHGELKPLILHEMAGLGLKNKKYGINLYNKNKEIYLPENSILKDITVEDFTFNRQSGKFTARLRIPVGSGEYTSRLLRGRTYAIEYVPSLNRTVAPGQEITAQDIAWTAMPTLQIGRNVIRDKKQVIGMTPRRGLAPATPLRLSDLRRPKIISRGHIVRITYSAGKINLTAIGKAIESGGRGDIIRVMNNASHKTIEAMVTGRDQVRVITAFSNIALLNTGN